VDGPAAAAGLQEGDRIVSVDGRPVKVFFDIVRATRDRTDEASLTQGLEVRYERGGEARTAVVRPKLDDKAEPVLDEKLMPTQESRKQARLLVGPRISRQPVPFGEALGLAVRQPVEMAVGLVSLAGRPERVTEDLGGPATIATQTVEASRQGLSGIVVFAAMLSISFGVFNLLPVSPLDGGQMLVALVELLRGGRRLSFRTQSAVANVSFVLLSILVITVLTADIKRHASPVAPPAQAR
jgi:regulator of sigma E protease